MGNIQTIKYPIAETFYSIIGEGVWTGTAAFFIRLAGCNLNCEFCDTNYQEKFQMTSEELLHKALEHPAKRVVITGGEPCIHKLENLVETFKGRGFKIHLETNGTLLPDTLAFNWIAVSPKSENVLNFMLALASEIKFLCGFEGWRDLLEQLLPKSNSAKWLLPIASKLGLDEVNTKIAVDYCLKNPTVRFCCQVHKVIEVR